MGMPNNYPTVSGDEKLTALREAGKVCPSHVYSELTPSGQYEVDAAYDRFRSEQGTAPILGGAPTGAAPAGVQLTGHNVVDPSADVVTPPNGAQLGGGPVADAGGSDDSSGDPAPGEPVPDAQSLGGAAPGAGQDILGAAAAVEPTTPTADSEGVTDGK